MAVDLAGFVEWAKPQGLGARRRPPPRRAPLRGRALLRRRRAGDRGPQAGLDPRPLRLPRPHRAGRAEPGRAGLQPEARREAAPGALSTEQMRSLLERIPARTPLELRDRAMLELAYSCGLRCEEIVNLDAGSVDFESEQLRVLGKGGKERILPVGEPAQRALRALPGPRPPRARRRSARAGAVPLQERPPPLQLRRHPPARPLDPRGGAGGRRLAAFTSAFLRDASARGWRRPAYDSGVAGPRIDLDHPGLHPSRRRPSARHLCRQPPPRMTTEFPNEPRIGDGRWKPV